MRNIMSHRLSALAALLVVLSLAMGCKGMADPWVPQPKPKPKPLPTLTFYCASASTIKAGDPCSLYFKTNGDSMVLKIGTETLRTFERFDNYEYWGVEMNVWPTATTTYTVTATNANGSTSESRTVTVTP